MNKNNQRRGGGKMNIIEAIREWDGAEQIIVKSKFNGWKKINKKESLEYAKWKINAITTGKTDEERLNMVNDCLRGIKFSLKDLLCQE